jgi:glycosyltransferase involved in cell wall biosynthesis
LVEILINIKMKISIITINYNNFHGLVKTIETVLSQTYSFIEFIVIDGGSTDSSKDYLESISTKIHYWVSESDRGVYHAMNKGLKVATGDFCVFLNSGDYLIDNNVIYKSSQLLNYNTSLFYGLIKWEDNGNLWNPKKDLKPFEMINRSCIPHQAVFFKTETIKKYGGYKEEFRVISDWGLMLEMIRDKYTIQKIDLVVSFCEKQGISAAYEQLAKKERIQYLLKYSFSTLIIGYLFLLRQYFKRK